MEPFRSYEPRADTFQQTRTVYEASPEDFKQLEDLDLSVSLANITQGTIFAPHYNSRTTFFIFVVSGRARIEMACPHVSSQQWQEDQRGRSQGRREWGEEVEKEEEEEEQKEKGRIHKIRSDLSSGDLFIVPAGHPLAIVTSGESFQAVGFGVNSRNNQRNFLAGKENIFKNVDRVARKLAFGVGEEQLEKVFKSQEESVFLPARRSQQEKGPQDAFKSILEAVAF